MFDEERESLLLLVDVAIAVCFSGLVTTFAHMIASIFFD